MARPRDFDEETVVTEAMMTFWNRGYEATSVEDLTGATGLSRSSLYHAFHSKRALFERALQRYMDGLDGMLWPLENGEPGLEGILRFFDNWEQRIRHGVVNPAFGCLIVNSTAELAPFDPSLKQTSRQYRQRLLVAFEAALRQADDRRETSPGEPSDRARLLVASVMGVFTTSRGNEATDEIIVWLRSVRSVVESWRR